MTEFRDEVEKVCRDLLDGGVEETTSAEIARRMNSKTKIHSVGMCLGEARGELETVVVENIGRSDGAAVWKLEEPDHSDRFASKIRSVMDEEQQYLSSEQMKEIFEREIEKHHDG